MTPPSIESQTFLRGQPQFLNTLLGGTKTVKICSSSQARACVIDTEPATELFDVFACPECKYVATSMRQINAHRHGVHGYIKPSRAFIGTDLACPACMKVFGTRTQALRHLNDSVRCADYHVHCCPIDCDLQEKLDDAEAERVQETKTNLTVAVQRPYLV